jgi:hypothetical protein
MSSSRYRTPSADYEGSTGKNKSYKFIEGIQPPTFTLSQGLRASDPEANVLTSVFDESSKVPLAYQGNILEPSTLKDVISGNKKFYRWSCITGIIMPNDSYQSKHYLFNLLFFRYRLWSFYLHFALCFQTIFMIVYLFYYSTTSHNSERKTILTIIQSFGFVLQNILLYPAIVYLRRELLFKRENINLEVYTESLTYAIRLCRKWLFVFTAFLAVFVSLETAFLDKSAWLSIALIIGIIIFFTPTNFFLVGLLSFLVFEQRLSFHTLNTVRDRIVAKDFTYTEYFSARESIDKRDRMTPINWLIFAALVNTVLAILLLFIISSYPQLLLFIFGEIFYVISGFGRQIIVLIVILLEVVKVNDIADQLLKIIVKSEWPEKEMIRLNLYVALAECPTGSTIFYFRPSKFQLMIQIVSSIIGMGIAIFWAIIFA